MMPDPEFYADCLQESFEELREATLSGKSKGKKPRRKRAAK
jgi:hypothetical protein